jgi:hypothetical protein
MSEHAKGWLLFLLGLIWAGLGSIPTTAVSSHTLVCAYAFVCWLLPAFSVAIVGAVKIVFD